jgi:hypothetical protein
MRINALGIAIKPSVSHPRALAVQIGLLTVVGDPVEQDKAIVFAGAIVLIAVQKFFTKLKQRLVPNLLFQYREPQASRHSRLLEASHDTSRSGPMEGINQSFDLS